MVTLMAMERNRREFRLQLGTNSRSLSINSGPCDLRRLALGITPGTLGRLMQLAPPLAWQTEYAHARTSAFFRKLCFSHRNMAA